MADCLLAVWLLACYVADCLLCDYLNVLWLQHSGRLEWIIIILIATEILISLASHYGEIKAYAESVMDDVTTTTVIGRPHSSSHH